MSRDELLEAVREKFSSEDLDVHVHERKSQEAANINNVGLLEQFNFLYTLNGEKWVKEVLLGETDEDNHTD